MYEDDRDFNFKGNALLFAENQKDYNITTNAIKAEAYKEFAELAQSRCAEQQGCLYSSDIGAIYNELVGEGNFSGGETDARP